MSTLTAGGMAEFALARESDCIAVPETMEFAVAGAFPVAYLSAEESGLMTGSIIDFDQQVAGCYEQAPQPAPVV